ncbi:hypothetical protein RugamoR1_12140 [Rugamonas sp. R1(2021)]
MQGAKWIKPILSNGPVAFIGKISYVLYLWHWPVIFAMTRLELTTPAWMLVAIGVSFVLSVATHFLIEQPLRYVNWSPKRTATALFLLPFLLTACSLGLARYTDNFVAFYPKKFQQDYRDSGQTVFNDKRASFCWSKDGVTPPTLCTVGDTKSQRKAVLLGDSHAYHLISFIDKLGQNNRLAIHDMTFTMCAPIENSPPKSGDPGFQKHAEACMAHGKAVMEYVLSQDDISVVLMAAVWDLYENPESGPNVKPTGHGYMPGQINKELADTVRKLESAGKQVVFIDDIPGLPGNMEDCVSNRLYLPGHHLDSCTYPSEIAMNRYQHIDLILSDMKRQFPKTAVIHTFDVPCDALVCRAELSETGLYSHNDRGHLGRGGSAIYYGEYLKRHPTELDEIFTQRNNNLSKE